MSSADILPVLIVGAGPTGLVLALTLLKNGVRVRIIEKDSKYHMGQRGAGIQPRTLEVYNLLGVLPDVFKKGRSMAAIRFYKLPGGTELLDKFDMMRPEDPTPSIPYINGWFLGQDRAEAILREHLAQYGCEVELGTELRSFEQDANRVVAHLVKRAGDEEIHESIECHWLAGADGARGVVRKQLGLTFLGEALTTQIIFGEIEASGIDQEHLHIWADPAASRRVVLRPTEIDGVFSFIISGHPDNAKIFADDEELKQALRDGTQREDITYGSVTWKSDYRPSVRMVNKFGEGRVFIAGDAAHVHSPTGGQGLNSSVQDALNLGWKLALVERGISAPSLLSTYTEERLPVITQMLDETTKLHGSTVGATGSKGSGSEAAWKRGNHLKQLGINYRWSSIVLDERVGPSEEKAKQPFDAYGINAGNVVRAGDRAPDAPGLVFTNGKDHESESIFLFRIFGPSYHTVLVFTASALKAQPVLEQLKSYPSDLIRPVVILPKDIPDVPAIENATLVLIDASGHASAGYAISGEDSVIVAVRPDGVIGCIAYGLPGLITYLGTVFSATV